MADDNLMDQDEIEQLLNQGQGDGPSAGNEESAAGGTSDESLGPDEIESLLGKGKAEDKPDDAAAGAEMTAATPENASAEPVTTAAESSAAPPPPPPAGDDDKLLAQDDIEKLLNQSATGGAKPPPLPTPKKEKAPAPLAGEGSVPQSDVEYLLNQAQQALESVGAGAEHDLPQGVAAFRLEEFSGTPATTENATIDLIRDVELDLKIELGRTNMYLEDVLKLRKGSVVPLDKLAGDPVDIYVNGRLIARGEVLVLNDNFCVRVAELIAGTNVGT